MASEEKKFVTESFGSAGNELSQSIPRSLQPVIEFPFQPIDLI